MLVSRTEVNVSGVHGAKISDFMINCTDEKYQDWWPGYHLAFHTLKRYPDEIGNLVYFDEYVAKRRLKFHARVNEYVPGKRIIWQLRFWASLPVWLSLEFQDHPEGVTVYHTFTIGFRGIGKILDPLLRISFSQDFQHELEEHARVEFKLLAEKLSSTEYHRV
jgi:hypothetical protein